MKGAFLFNIALGGFILSFIFWLFVSGPRKSESARAAEYLENYESCVVICKSCHPEIEQVPLDSHPYMMELLNVHTQH